MHQPQKFDDAKDSIITKEWLELVESTMSLFNMMDQDKVRMSFTSLSLVQRHDGTWFER